MNINWISDFLELTVEESFTATAEKCNISQSAFSRRIFLLEEWVGTSLIDREAEVFTLTASGERFAKGAQVLLSGFSEVLDDCCNKNNTVKVACIHSLSCHFFADWYTTIQQKNTNLEVSLEVRDMYKCIHLLKSNQADFYCHMPLRRYSFCLIRRAILVTNCGLIKCY